jgi:hypothetical protein
VLIDPGTPSINLVDVVLSPGVYIINDYYIEDINVVIKMLCTMKSMVFVVEIYKLKKNIR